MNDLGINPVDFYENDEKEIWINSESLDHAIQDSHAIIILTEWSEFEEIKWDKFFKKMAKPAWIFDTRSIINVDLAKKAGFIMADW